MGPILQPTPFACAIAAALVVAGAPLFSAGLRSWRLRRHLCGLEERSLSEEPTAFGLTRGRVALESPLVGPLSGKPCAGYRLEVRGSGGMRVATLEDFRPFRLVGDGVTARVAGADEATWDLSLVAERAVTPGDALSENLTALLARSPEALWLRRAGMTITLAEHALLAGEQCFLVGSARRAQPYELISEVELARTGTDDARVASARSQVAATPDLWIEAGGHLDYLRISDRAPTPAALAVPAWKTLGVIVGPLLGLAGMLYLAAVADALRALTRFVR